MSAPLRNAYLEALGIDRWVTRHAAPQTPTAEPAMPLAAARSAAPGPVMSTAAMPEAAVLTAAPAPARAPQPATLVPAAEWEPLRDQVAACTACDLCKTRTQAVFGVGNTRAEWLVIGEAPGAEED